MSCSAAISREGAHLLSGLRAESCPVPTKRPVCPSCRVVPDTVPARLRRLNLGSVWFGLQDGGWPVNVQRTQGKKWVPGSPSQAPGTRCIPPGLQCVPWYWGVRAVILGTLVGQAGTRLSTPALTWISRFHLCPVRASTTCCSWSWLPGWEVSGKSKLGITKPTEGPPLMEAGHLSSTPLQPQQL